MLSRHWTGVAKKEKPSEYIHHLKTGPLKIELIAGFISAQIQKRKIKMNRVKMSVKNLYKRFLKVSS